MDIQYLLWLQGIRESAGKGVENFFALLSDSIFFIIAASIMIFLLLDKKKGAFVLFAYSIGSTLNAIVKVTACVYRPWIRDPRIVPAGKALGLATGYSFPSGHTSAVSSCVFGMANQFKGNRVLAALLSAYLLLVAFSRNFLGCHTPQDVLVALLEGLAAMFAAKFLLAFVQKNKDNDTIVFAAAALLAAFFAAFILLKPYPIDKDSAGNILVSPQKMQNDAFFDLAFALGFVHAWFLERRFVKFSTDNLNAKKRVLRLAVCLALVFFVMFALYPAAKNAFDKRLAKFIGGYLRSFVCVYLAPLIFTKIEKALKW